MPNLADLPLRPDISPKQMAVFRVEDGKITWSRDYFFDSRVSSSTAGWKTVAERPWTVRASR
jgi:hypothetical protein